MPLLEFSGFMNEREREREREKGREERGARVRCILSFSGHIPKVALWDMSKEHGSSTLTIYSCV